MARGNVHTRVSGSFVTIDVSGLRGFVTALRKASPALSRELRAGLRKGGDIVRDEAKVRAASAKMPKNISESIRTRTSGVRVSVVAGNKNATAAAAFEHEGYPGTFRHPLFGNRAYWYEQEAHPYLRPAAEANAPKVADAVLDAVADVIDQALSEASST